MSLFSVTDVRLTIFILSSSIILITIIALLTCLLFQAESSILERVPLLSAVSVLCLLHALMQYFFRRYKMKLNVEKVIHSN